MIENAIRDLFWALAKLFLSMADWMYEILQAVIGIDLSGNIITFTWSFMLLFLTFACFIRIAFLLLHQMADDEQEHIDYGKLGKRIVGVFVAVTLSLTFFTFSLGIPKTVTDIYNRVIVYDTRLVPSSAVISSTAKTSVSSSLGNMSSTDAVISVDMIDEELNKKEDGEYKYFFGFSELFLCIAGAFAVMCVQLNIVMDVIMRLFLNVFRFVIGFIPISSIIEDNSTFGEWVRDLMSDTIVLCSSLIFTNMVFGFMTTTAITSLNGIVRIVVFTVALMGVYRASEVIAKYMGASNLSSGGRIGSTLLGIGAFGAIRGAGKVMRSAVKYGAKGVSSGVDYVSSKFGGNSDNGSDNTSFNGSSTINNGGLGESINDSDVKSDYFMSTGGGIDIGGDTSINGNLNQNVDESILDTTPTSINMQSDETSESTFFERSQGTVFASDSDTSLSQDTIVSSSDNPSISSMTHTGDSEVTTQGKQVEDNPINKGFEKTGSTFIQDGRFSFAGAGFVDTPPSGHLFKGSSAVYKQGVRERFNTTSIDTTTKVNSASNYTIEKPRTHLNGNEGVENEDNR